MYTCARRFLRNFSAEINDTLHNNYIEGTVNAHYSIFKIGSFRAPWWKIELLQKSVSRREDLHTCARRFLSNCRVEFNEAWYNNYIEVVINAHCLIFKIR